MMSESRLRELLDRFRRLRLVVVGDFFLDKYLVIEPRLAETSLETGLTCHQVVGRRCAPGAAGTVVSNLAALGAGAILPVGVIGDDGEGFELRRGLERAGASLEYLVSAPERFTPTYTKPMRLTEAGEREMERIDIKNRQPLPVELEGRVVDALRALVHQVDAVIVADQVQERNCGVVTDGVRDELARLAGEHSGTLFFADSRERVGEFRNVVVKPNRLELARALGASEEGEISREAAGALGQRLAARTGRPVVVTLSAEGSVFCTRDVARHVPAVPVTGETDPVGAGDSTTAGIVCARCAGADWEEALFVGNLVASVTVQKLGTTGTASPRELLQQLERARWQQRQA